MRPHRSGERLGRAHVVAAVALTVGAATVSGCRGGGGEAGGKPLSSSEFRAKANAICADVYRQYKDIDLAGKAGVLTDGAEKLKELVPPAAKARAFRRFLKALDGEAGAWKEMVSGGTSSDLTDRFIEQESQISSAAAAMGTKKCATVAGAQ
jgi:hypothetical protein